METPDFKRKWTSWQTKIRQEYPDWTAEDLHYEEGKEADLVKRLEHKTKKNKEEIYNWLHLMG